MKHILNLILLSLTLVPYTYGMNSAPTSALELELIEAAKIGNLAQVQALIANPLVGVNAKGVNNATALHAAACNGHKEVVEMLLAAGADVNAKDNNNFTALHVAAAKGHKEVVEMLLAAKADINAKAVDNSNALHAAAQNGHKEVVKMLLAAGVDVNAKDHFNFTALHVAAFNGHKNLVEVLLAAGADVEAKSNNNLTALHVAALGGHKEVVGMLLATGADVNVKGLDNGTALHWAAQNGHKEVVGMLLAAEADVNGKIADNRTALHLAALNGHKEVVGMLLSAGADVNSKDVNNVTALHVAAQKGHKEVLEILLNYTAQVEGTLSNHPVVVEAQNNQKQLRTAPNFKAVVQLLNKGVYACPAIKQFIDLKRQLLLDAVKQNNVESVRALLKDGFSLNTCDKDRNTLLHLAILNNSKTVLELLLSFCSSNNSDLWGKRNSNDLTPIEAAVAVGNIDLVRALISIGSKSAFKDAPQVTGSKHHREEDGDTDSNKQARR